MFVDWNWRLDVKGQVDLRDSRIGDFVKILFGLGSERERGKGYENLGINLD